MIGLLTSENTRTSIPDEEMAKVAPPSGEAYDEDADAESSRFMQGLIATVAGFDDERAIPALAGAVCWGDTVTNALLAFGDKGLARVLDQLQSRNSSLRTCSLIMVVSLEAPNGVVSQTRIKELIRSSLSDPDPSVRTRVVWAVDCRKDRQDLVPLLQHVAKTDPFILPADGPALDGGDGGKFYPVRADARRALRHIQNNQPCGIE